MSGTVSVASEAHADALAAIHAAAFPPAERWGRDAILLQLALPGVIGLIDERGGMLLGRVASGEAEVLTLAVHPDARRQGIATVLLTAALTAMQSRGAGQVFLEVAAGNTAAQQVYRRFGFTEAGRRRRYYPDGSDALVLRMNIA